MKLYLVQHAKAKPKEEDPEQHLSEKGWSDLEKVKSFISNNITFGVNYIFHSPKARAKQTAAAFEEVIDSQQGLKEEINLKPLDDPLPWVERIEKTDQDIMIVGHKPNLSKLSSRLLCHDEKDIINFQQGGIVCLERDESGSFRLNYMIVPDILI